jgi:glycosyltransferase involved in cell wall biosynthesis
MVGTNLGGIETYLLKMNSAIQKEIAFDYVIEENECLHESEIFSYNGCIYHVASRVAAPLKNICDNLKLLRDKKDSHEIVYFNLSSLSWIFPILLAKTLGYHVIVHAHNSFWIEANNTILHRTVNHISKWCLRYLKIHRFTCSQLCADFLFFPTNKFTMIYNATYIENYLFNPVVRCRIRSELGLGAAPVLGFVGRLNDEKNPLFAVRIVKKLVKMNCSIRFLMIGDGPLRDKVRKMIDEFSLNDHVMLLGNQGNVNELMSAIDALVMPSISEGLPCVLVEAQTSGLTCIVSDVVTREVDIADGCIKYLSLAKSEAEWANTILENMDTNKEMRTNCGKVMKDSNFNIFKESIRFKNILKEISGSI